MQLFVTDRVFFPSPGIAQVTVPLEGIAGKVSAMLEEIQDSMFQRAKAERDSRMKQAFDFEGMPRTHTHAPHI